jgi:uncharacterized protein YdhG (YjbR/CyaY superfamily)
MPMSAVMKNSKMPKNVDAYIAAAPKGVQQKPRQVRKAIKDVAPDTVESISYGMPFYSYKGTQGISRRLCYFGLLKANIGLYLRPPLIKEHMAELAEYATTKSALLFSLDRPMPVHLVKKIVAAQMKMDEAGE